MGISRKRKEMGEEKWVEYQKNRTLKKAREWYKNRNPECVINWRRRTKIKLIEYKGNKCVKCGYNKECPSAFDFHHLDPTEKEIKIGGSSLSFEKLKKETDKCVLVCKNCHAEIHEEKYKEQRKQAIKKWGERDKKIEYIKEQKEERECAQCKLLFKPQDYTQKYCSIKCSIESQKRVVRPTQEQLLKEIKELGYCGTGRKYGVSDNAIRKWVK